VKLIRQNSSTFIRQYGSNGYITSQLTKKDRVYNDSGAVFLSAISRQPTTVADIANHLISRYTGVSLNQLAVDLYEFLEDLENNKYVVTWDSEVTLSDKEPIFSYKLENPKTNVINFADPDYGSPLKDTPRFFYEKFKDSPAIFGAQLELTSCCNERCLHCYIPHEDKVSTVDTSLLLDVLDQLRDMGTLGLTLSGGEPFLHKDISTILRKARANDFMISVLSNATLVDDEKIALLKEVNINLLQISVYSMDPDEHDAVTMLKDSHAKTMRSIDKLLAADVPIQISCPVMSVNRHAYKDVLKWAYKHKIKAYSDFIMMAKSNHDTSNLKYRISLAETEELLHEIVAVDEDYTTLTEYQPLSKDLEDYKTQPVCGVGIDNICMAANGKLYPCSGWQNYEIGDVRKERIKDIWETSEKLKFLRTITKSSFPQCLPCDAKDYCAMCLVRNFNENKGDMFKVSDHFCKVAHLNKKIVEEHKAIHARSL